MAKRIHHGEVIAPAEVADEITNETVANAVAKVDWTSYRKDIPSTREKFAVMLDQLQVTGKEMDRLSFLCAAAAVVLAIQENSTDAMDLFLSKLPDGTRKNAFRTYFETVGPVVWDKDREVPNPKDSSKTVRKAGFVMNKGKMKHQARQRSSDKAAFDTNLMAKSPWEMSKEPEYRGTDLAKAAKQLLARAKKDQAREIEAKKAGKTIKNPGNFHGINKFEAFVTETFH